MFFTSYKREYEEEKINFNHWKIPTVYCPSKYKNLLAIHLLSAISSNPQAKYHTYRCQQSFVPNPGACLVYQPRRAFWAYFVGSGKFSIIVEKAIVIDSVIPENFYKPTSQDITSPLYITPYTLVDQMPRSGSNYLPAFMQCGKNQTWETIFRICLPDFSLECLNYHNHVPYYLNAKLIEMGK